MICDVNVLLLQEEASSQAQTSRLRLERTGASSALGRFIHAKNGSMLTSTNKLIQSVAILPAYSRIHVFVGPTWIVFFNAWHPTYYYIHFQTLRLNALDMLNARKE